MSGQPVTKLKQLLDMMAAGEWERALKFAARFHDLGTHKRAITLAAESLTNPRFYRQLGQDPDANVRAGVEALKERYLK